MYFRAYLVANEGNMRETIALLLGAAALEPSSTALSWAMTHLAGDEINAGIDQISMDFVSLAIHSYLDKKSSATSAARELAGNALAEFVGRVWQLRKRDCCSGTNVLYSYLLLLRTVGKHTTALKLLLDLWEYPSALVPTWRVCVGVGEILADCGNYREAITWFKRAQFATPSPTATNNNYFLFELGVAYSVEQRWHEAARCFDAFCKTNPRATLARLARAHLEDVRANLGPMIPFSDDEEGNSENEENEEHAGGAVFFIAYQNQGFKEIRNIQISQYHHNGRDKSKFEHMLRLKAATAWDLPLKMMRRFEFFNLDTRRNFGSIAQLLSEARAGEFFRLGVRLPGEAASTDFGGNAEAGAAKLNAALVAPAAGAAANVEVEVEVCL